MAPTVSVVIPAYNHERFIRDAVDSVLNQTMQDLELIVVDDGSTDSTGEIVKAYDDPRLQYHWQENQDAFNTINNGMRMAKGRFITILNSDDIYEPTRLERLLFAHRDTAAEVMFTDVQPIDDDNQPLDDPEFGWNHWHQRNRQVFLDTKDLYLTFQRGNVMVTTSNLFMTRHAYETVGEFSSLRYLHDYDYIFRLLRAFPGKVRYLHNQKLVKYRIHGGNTLGEAAIIGREQDQQVIRDSVLEIVPEDQRQYVQAGIDRLIELEHELADVKQQLAEQNAPPPPPPPPTAPAEPQSRICARLAGLCTTVLDRIKRKLG